MRSVALFFLAATVFVFNPAFLCGGDGGYRFGEREVRTALAGTWVVTPDGGEAMTLHLDAAATVRTGSRELIRSAAACSERTLVRSAGACVDSTRVQLDITGQGDVAVTGELEVFGTRWDAGYVRLHFGSRTVIAHVAEDGRVSEVTGGTLAHRRP